MIKFALDFAVEFAGVPMADLSADIVGAVNGYVQDQIRNDCLFQGMDMPI